MSKKKKQFVVYGRDDGQDQFCSGAQILWKNFKNKRVASAKE
jgi:hypothetical protein